MPQHALLGSLIHAPNAINDLEKFLTPRDFSTHPLRALYLTVRGLAETNELQDVINIPGDGARMAAAAANFRAVVKALQEQRFTHLVITDPKTLIAQVNAAAPPSTIPYRGVYDEGAQMRLGRMVLEDSLRRHINGLGIHITRVSARSRLLSYRGTNVAEDMRRNLDTVSATLDRLAVRLARAVERTGPAADDPVPVTPSRAVETISRQPRQSLLQVLSAPLVRRHEQRLIHAALHSGRSLDVGLTPDDFASRRHANTWAAILRVQARGDAVNYVSVFEELRPTNPGQLWSDEVMPLKELTDLGNTIPPTGEAKLAKSLNIVVNASLKRIAARARASVQAVAGHQHVDPQALLDHAQAEISKLKDRADTAAARHNHATALRDGHGATR